jgi:RHS repeat-associated protein
VHGSNAATDDPLMAFTGSTVSSSSRHWLHADHLGSIIATTDGSGANPAINTYDEYGIPGSANAGRFGYTGQTWLYEIGVDYYKARIYSPTLGRFLQTDPVGYEGGINLYAYVGNDPVDANDPTGEFPDIIADIAFIGFDAADIKENGLNWTNGVALGADIIGAAIPGATGLGLGTRGLMEVGSKALHATQSRQALTMSRVEKMAKDMKANGFDKSKPISVKEAPDGKRYIVDGHHRVEAAKKAGIDKVPAHVEKVDQKAAGHLREEHVNAKCEDANRCRM